MTYIFVSEISGWWFGWGFVCQMINTEHKTREKKKQDGDQWFDLVALSPCVCPQKEKAVYGTRTTN
jgi:hypothetical protein